MTSVVKKLIFGLLTLVVVALPYAAVYADDDSSQRAIKTYKWVYNSSTQQWGETTTLYKRGSKAYWFMAVKNTSRRDQVVKVSDKLPEQMYPVTESLVAYTDYRRV